jgi:hypothetical protein
LFNKHRLSRYHSRTRQVIQSDIFARGFQPWREDEAEVHRWPTGHACAAVLDAAPAGDPSAFQNS